MLATVHLAMNFSAHFPFILCLALKLHAIIVQVGVTATACSSSIWHSLPMSNLTSIPPDHDELRLRVLSHTLRELYDVL